MNGYPEQLLRMLYQDPDRHGKMFVSMHPGLGKADICTGADPSGLYYDAVNITKEMIGKVTGKGS